jgi:Na+-translocating ferredoxin:NAD+ oxidoreductase RNF subunit RnfB
MFYFISAKFKKDLVIASQGNMNAVGFAAPSIKNGCSICVRSCPVPYVISLIRTNLKISICRHDKFQR